MELKQFFTSDVEASKNFIGKFVELTLPEGAQESGFVYVIDPISQAVVLHRKCEEKSKLIIIPRHVVVEVKVSCEPICEDLLLKDKPRNLDNLTEIIERRDKLKAWFKEREVNLELSGDDGLNLSLGNGAIIEPPYGPENILVDTTVALDRIWKIIDEMPSDFKV